MSKWFKHNGAVCLRRDDAEEATAPLPSDATDIVVFDGEANQSVIDDFSKSCSPYALSNGVLTKNGFPVALAAGGPNKQIRDAMKVAVQAIDANKAFLAISFPTAQQAAAQTKELTKQMNAVLRRLVLVIKEIGKE